MATPESTVFSLALEHLAAIVTGATVLLLAFLSHIGKAKQADLAKAVLTESPVSHAELLECQMAVLNQVNATITDGFADARKDWKQDLQIVIDSHIKQSHP